MFFTTIFLFLFFFNQNWTSFVVEFLSLWFISPMLKSALYKITSHFIYDLNVHEKPIFLATFLFFFYIYNNNAVFLIQQELEEQPRYNNNDVLMDLHYKV